MEYGYFLGVKVNIHPIGNYAPATIVRASATIGVAIRGYSIRGVPLRVVTLYIVAYCLQSFNSHGTRVEYSFSGVVLIVSTAPLPFVLAVFHVCVGLRFVKKS